MLGTFWLNYVHFLHVNCGTYVLVFIYSHCNIPTNVWYRSIVSKVTAVGHDMVFELFSFPRSFLCQKFKSFVLLDFPYVKYAVKIKHEEFQKQSYTKNSFLYRSLVLANLHRKIATICYAPPPLSPPKNILSCIVISRLTMKTIWAQSGFSRRWIWFSGKDKFSN